MNIRLGVWKIYVDTREDKLTACCPNCGHILLNLDVKSVTTGYFYCSRKCAKEHVNSSGKSG